MTDTQTDSHVATANAAQTHFAGRQKIRALLWTGC